MLTKRKLWTESNAMNSAPAPDANGEPETGARLPDVLTVNDETVPEPEFETKARLAGACGMMLPLIIVVLPHPTSTGRTPHMAKMSRTVARSDRLEEEGEENVGKAIRQLQPSFSHRENGPAGEIFQSARPDFSRKTVNGIQHL